MQNLLVDGHVHLYPCFDTERFLAALSRNFAAAELETGVAPGTPGCALLTEANGADAFGDLRAGVALPPGWRVTRPADAAAAILRHETGERNVILIAGCQIRTREGIEVLAIGTGAARRNGDPLSEILEELAEDGVPAILPWGVGKWIGARGRRVARALGGRPRRGLFAGDNAGRPRGWPCPAQFAGRPVLPGSDPLPYPGGAADAGRYGFVLEGPHDPGWPAASVRARLLELERQPRRFGRRVGPLRFVSQQGRLRLRRPPTVSD